MARGDVKQANFLLPADLLDELRQHVPRGEQSAVVAAALRKELKRLRFREAVSEAFAAWSNEQHPELEAGVDQYVRRLRRSSREARAFGEER